MGNVVQQFWKTPFGGIWSVIYLFDSRRNKDKRIARRKRVRLRIKWSSYFITISSLETDKIFPTERGCEKREPTLSHADVFSHSHKRGERISVRNIMRKLLLIVGYNELYLKKRSDSAIRVATSCTQYWIVQMSFSTIQKVI